VRISYHTNVKLRDVPRALGLASSVPREYPYEIATFTLPIDGEVQLARWLHPNETPKVVTQEHVDALRAFLREGDVAIDIGAHTGDTSLPMALAVGRGGAVFALEPNPYVFKVLSATATLNPTKARIVPLMFAAMPNDGEFEFEYSDSGYCNGGFHHAINRWKHGHFSQLRVTGRNLADYLQKEAPAEIPRIRFVKIDTEGYDRTVVPTSKPKSTGIFQPASGSRTSTICDNWGTGCSSARSTRFVARSSGRQTCLVGNTSTSSPCLANFCDGPEL
jgi:FkbM family methyltransferase